MLIRGCYPCHFVYVEQVASRTSWQFFLNLYLMELPLVWTHPFTWKPFNHFVHSCGLPFEPGQQVIEIYQIQFGFKQCLGMSSCTPTPYEGNRDTPLCLILCVVSAARFHCRMLNSLESIPWFYPKYSASFHCLLPSMYWSSPNLLSWFYRLQKRCHHRQQSLFH